MAEREAELRMASALDGTSSDRAGLPTSPRSIPTLRTTIMKTAEIRRRFLDFFATRGHEVVPSAPLLYNDPTLLFVNAGMVPFKPYFTGAETPPFDRAASVQKCVRTLDIEEVGKTTRHGTFFQMNGNFSFGDYFKAEAIQYAWDLVTGSQDAGGYGFDPDKIWVTVLHTDDEAALLWENIAGLPRERIQRRGLLDNYWHMGVPGPGRSVQRDLRRPRPGVRPRRRPDRRRGPVPGDLEPRLHAGGARRGPGQGRLRRRPAAAAQEHRHRAGPGAGRLPAAGRRQPVRDRPGLPGDRARRPSSRASATAPTTTDDVRMRVVADHIRSGLMLIGDGVTPGNEARGYVLRRLLRRVVRSMRLLGVAEPVLPELLPVSRDLMKESYPELETDWARISQIAYAEEEAFRRTLTTGTQIFDVAVADAKAEQPDRADRRPGVPAARHVRLPDRPDPGDGRRAGSQRRRRPLPAR